MRKQTKLVAALSATALLAVGASMTSFAAGWTEIGDGEYVYLDSDGERITEEWRRSGSEYYWLDEDGLIAKSQLIEDDDDIYYVNSSGIRLKNDWARVENEDGEEVNGEEVEILYYFFGSNGKAYKADSGADFKKRSISWNGSNRYFFFDEDGHMASGWVDFDGDTYYCGTELQGYAHTGWNQLEVREELEDDEDYEDVEWFYFNDTTAKMRKNQTWYYDGWYYTFDGNGVLEDDWYTTNVATANGTATNGEVEAFTSVSGTKRGTGWIYTDKDDDGEYEYYYLVTYRNSEDKTVRNVPFNSTYAGEADSDDTDKWAAKSISGKVYLFDGNGKMLTGVKYIPGNLPEEDPSGVAAKALEEGYYYFNNASGSTRGQMLTGKQSYESDGETSYYYFDKDTGKALTNEVRDGIVYGSDGKRIQAEDGNSNMLYDVTVEGGIKYRDTVIPEGSTIIVSSTGRLRTRNVKVDGEEYDVTVGNANTPWKAERVDD